MSRHGFLLPDIVNDPAASIADHSARPRHPGQILVSSQFNPFLTMIAAAGKSHNVSDSRAIGIFTQHFWRNTDAGKLQKPHGLCGPHVLSAGKISKVLRLRLENLVTDFLRLHLQDIGQFLKVIGGKFFGEGRIRPDAAHRLAGRKHHAIAVQNFPALADNGERPGITRLALILKKIRRHCLQPNRTANESEKKDRNKGKCKVRAPFRNRNDDERTFGAFGFGLLCSPISLHELEELIDHCVSRTLHEVCHDRPPAPAPRSEG